MLSYETLLGIALLLPQAFALLRVPVGPNGDYKRLAKKDTFEVDTSVQTYIIPGTDFYFGSDHQKVFVSFDTGSYTSYVQDSSISENGFNGNDSSSLVHLNKDYSVDYADGTSFTGTWVADHVSFDDAYTHSANLSFGLVDKAADSTNIFGLGYYPDSPDPTFIDTLYDQNVISKRVFSVYQDSTSEGEFTFGGVDTAKFSGDLTAVPVIDAQAWKVKLFDFFHGCETLTNGNTYPVLIDSGSSTGLYVPEDIYYKLINKLEAQYESTLKGYIFDCLKAESLTLDFGGLQVEIPTSSFVQGVKGTDYCTINWRISTQDMFQLGWTFFNNFYIVFDADSKEILFGLPNKSASGENLVEVSDSVPSSVQAASYSQTDIGSTNSIDYSTASTVSIFASSSSLGDYYNAPTGLTTCTASSSSLSSSSSASSSSASSISSAVSSSSAISSSSSITSSAESTSSGISSSSSVEPSSSFISSISSVSSSSVVEPSVSSSASLSEFTSSDLSIEPSSAIESSETPLSSFPSITSSSFSTSSFTASSSSFSGYFNSTSSAASVSASSSVLPSSIATPSINGSFVDAPIWDLYIPGALGPWSLVEIYTTNSPDFTYHQIEFYVGSARVSPSVFQQSGGSFQYNYADEIADDEVLQAHIVGNPFTGQSATIELAIAITDRNGAKLVKRATQTYSLSNTITASGSPSSVSSIVASSSSDPAVSEAPSSVATDDSSANSDELSTSTAVVEHDQTTVATITSCSNNVCTEQPTTVIVQTTTQTIGNIIQVYTTYCPLSSETTSSTSTSPVASSPASTTPVAIASTTPITTQTGGSPGTSTEENVSSNSQGVESISTDIIQVTSTLPNGEVTVASSTVQPTLESTTTSGSSGSVLVSTQLIPTSTQGDSTLFITQLVTKTTNTVSSGIASSSIPTLLSQGSNSSSNGTNPQTPVQVSEYEGSGHRLVAGMLSALPVVVMMFF